MRERSSSNNGRRSMRDPARRAGSEAGGNGLLRPWVWAVGVALLLGGLETIKAVVAAAARRPPNEFGLDEALVTNMPWWLLWALLAPVVVWLARRLPFRTGRRVRSVLAHAAATLVVSLVHLTVSAAGVWIAVSHEFLSLRAQVGEFLAGYLLTDIVTYWAIVAAYATYDSRRRLRGAERERHALELKAAKLEVEAAQLEAQMTEARLDALRRELNPHFLFNVLNTASALARRGESDAAVRVLAGLGELLRRTLVDELEHQVTVEEEIELLELYLNIERVRFGDRLETEVRVDPAVRRALVPTLILQPLVENAVRHGVSAVRGAARLEIHARAEGSSLDVRVRDSGRGLDHAADPARDGVGLRNTRRRLSALYGDAAALALSPRAGGGAEAMLRVPLQIEEDVRVGV